MQVWTELQSYTSKAMFLRKKTQLKIFRGLLKSPMVVAARLFVAEFGDPVKFALQRLLMNI